jgi:SOS-response transcriptional repressor LexA
MATVMRTKLLISLRQQEFLDFIRDFEKVHGQPPTFKEIAIGMGISSKGSVSAMIGTLAQMGLIRKAAGASRGTKVRSTVQGLR